jgi:hypothetical protein
MPFEIICSKDGIVNLAKLPEIRAITYQFSVWLRGHNQIVGFIKFFDKWIESRNGWRLPHQDTLVLVHAPLMLIKGPDGVRWFSFINLLLNLLVFIFNRLHLVFFVDCVQGAGSSLVQKWKRAHVSRHWQRYWLQNCMPPILLDDLTDSSVQFHVLSYKSLLPIKQKIKVRCEGQIFINYFRFLSMI